MEKGELSIFFCIIMTIIISFILVCIEGARDCVIRMQIESVVDIGLDSIFAEYHRELKNQYQLFFIDTSYGTNSPSLRKTQEHFMQYMMSNFQPSQDFRNGKKIDFCDIYVEDIEFLSIDLATDHNGNIFQTQAIDYMKYKYGIKEVEKLWNKESELNQAITFIEEEQLLNMNVQEEKEIIDSQIKWQENLVIAETSDSESSQISVSEKTERDLLFNSNNKGILSTVVEKPETLSQQSISSSELLSNREKNQGNGNIETETNSLQNSILLNEYMTTFFKDYSAVEKEKEESNKDTKNNNKETQISNKETQKSSNNTQTGNTLKYELEYIIAGNKSDIENLKEVVNQLILLRAASNITYLYTDTVKKAEADVLAWTVATAMLIPQSQPVIKQGILLTWAYMESLEDVKILLKQGNVPLKKTKNQWKLSLENAIFQNTSKEKHKENENGLTYSQYLKVLLYFENNQVKTQRAMNLIELNIRQTEGNKNFRLDGCIAGVKAKVTLYSSFGYEYDIVRSYYYMKH